MQNQIKHPVGIPPFVIIPGHDLDRRAQYTGTEAVDNGGMGIALKINGACFYIDQDTLRLNLR